MLFKIHILSVTHIKTKLTWIGQKCDFVYLKLSAVSHLNCDISSIQCSSRTRNSYIYKRSCTNGEVSKGIADACFTGISDESAKSVEKSWIGVFCRIFKSYTDFDASH